MAPIVRLTAESVSLQLKRSQYSLNSVPNSRIPLSEVKEFTIQPHLCANGRFPLSEVKKAQYGPNSLPNSIIPLSEVKKLSLLFELYDDTTATWIQIACFKNVGSCNYTNICDLLSRMQECPDPLIAAGFHCQCPFMEGSYYIDDGTFRVNTNFLPAGQYRAKADLHYGSTQVFCLEATFSLNI